MDDRTAVFNAIREAYGFAPGVRAHPITERVWRLSWESGDVAVKLYAAQHEARAQKEAAVLAHLQAHGDARFRVQTLQCTADGKPLWTGLDTHVLMTHWEKGQSRTYDTFTLDEWYALGASLASLHLSLERLRLPALDTIKARLAAIDVDEVRSSLLALVSAPALLADSRLSEGAAHGAVSLRAYVDACLRLIDTHYPGSLEAFPDDDPLYPVHNDYNQANYLFDGTLPPIIIDWEAAIGAPREYEVVRCLNHLPLEAPASAERFVQGYLRVRPLRVDRMAWAVDAACLQHALKRWLWEGWLHDPGRSVLPLQGPMRMATMMADARDHLIEFYVRCCEAGGGQGE